MALVLAGKLLVIRRDTKRLTLTIRPTTTTQQDGKTLVVMMEDTDNLPRCGRVIATGADPIQVEVKIDWKDGHSLLQFIQDTAIDQTVRLALTPEGYDVNGGLHCTIRPAGGEGKEKPDDGTYTLVSFQRGGLSHG